MSVPEVIKDQRSLSPSQTSRTLLWVPMQTPFLLQTCLPDATCSAFSWLVIIALVSQPLRETGMEPNRWA